MNKYFPTIYDTKFLAEQFEQYWGNSTIEKILNQIQEFPEVDVKFPENFNKYANGD